MAGRLTGEGRAAARVFGRREPGARATLAEAWLLAGILLAFTVIARLSHAARPTLAVLLIGLVIGLSLRSFHLGLSLYLLLFPFVALLPDRFLGVVGLNPSNLMLAGLGLVLLSGRVGAGPGGPSPLAGPVLRALVAIYLWYVVAIFLGWVASGVPLRDGFDTLRKFLAVTLPLAFGGAAARQGERARRFVLGSAVGAVLITALWGFIASGMGISSEHARATGRLGQSNSFGAFLALALPGMVALAASGKRLWLRAIGAAGALLCVINLFNAASRGSLLAAGLAVAVLGLLRHRGVLAAAVVAAALLGPALLPERVLDRFAGTFEGREENEGLDSSAYLRREMYRILPEAYGEHPILGGGLGSFPFTAHRLGRPELARSPHSFYIMVLTELGLVGACLFLWLAAALGRQLWRRLRGPAGALDPALAACALAASAALLTVCFFQKPFEDNEFILPLFFLALGLTLGLPATGRGQGHPGPAVARARWGGRGATEGGRD